MPSADEGLDPQSGAGRVWHNGVEALRGEADVVGVPLRGRARARAVWRRPDVLLASGHDGAVSRREPVAVIVHGAAWAVEPDFASVVPAHLFEAFVALTEAALGSADVVITPSAYTRDAVLAGYGFAPERVVAVHHGVDTRVFSPHAAEPAERPYVLFAAVATRHKNLGVLRDAVEGLARRGLPHELVIAGALPHGEPPEVVERVTADLPGAPGRVRWAGAVGDAELARLMAGADAFCLPSLYDSFGLPVLEAMACGCPVVVSDRGALPEVVGDAGVVCAPTAPAVEDALARVLTDPALAARLRDAGLARSADLTWRRTARGWLGALERAAGRG